MSPRSDLLSASGALFLINSVIVFNAASAELVKALLHIKRVDVNVRAHIAEQVLLQSIEEVNIDDVRLLPY